MSTFYFDSSVLLPIIIREHELHEACVAVLRDCLQEGNTAASATHALAEVYRHLTRSIPPYDLLPEEAQLAVTEHLGNLLEVVSLNLSDYEAAIDRCVTLNLTGPIIYDALHYQAALKAGAATLLTDNTRDFLRLRREEETVDVRGVRN